MLIKNKYHYLVCGWIEFVSLYARPQSDIFTGFIRSSRRRWPNKKMVMIFLKIWS